MNWIARLGTEFAALRRGRTGRDTQLRLDTARLYILTAPGFSKSLPAAVSRVALDDLPPFEEQAQHVAEYLSTNATDLIESPPTSRPQPRFPVTDGKTIANESIPFQPFSAKQLRGRYGRSATSSRQFSVHVRESSIPNAGLGVFVEGIAEAGSLITLYPGLTYRPSEVCYMPDYPNVSKNNEYLMWRYDGVIVDGSADSVSRVLAENGATAAQERELSAYASGQFVNHPPPGGAPNALQYSYDVDLRKLSQKCIPRVPNRNWVHDDMLRENSPSTDAFSEQGPGHRRVGFAQRTLRSLEDMAIRQRVASANSSALQGHTSSPRVFNGLAIVATGEIKDEEVFINYRFNPHSAELPSWYEDCDPEESQRRWVQEGFWA